jgi:hypothetical protein
MSSYLDGRGSIAGHYVGWAKWHSGGCLPTGPVSPAIVDSAPSDNQIKMKWMNMSLPFQSLW